MLKSQLTGMPVRIQRTVYPAHIPHTHPGQVCRTDKITVYLLFRQSHLLPDTGKNGFIANQGQRHIDAMKSHPVDFLFPACPIPIRHRVAISTDIKIIMIPERGLYPDGRSSRQFFRKTDIIAAPGIHTQTVSLDIIIESPAKRYIVRSFQMQNSILYGIFIIHVSGSLLQFQLYRNRRLLTYTLENTKSLISLSGPASKGLRNKVFPRPASASIFPFSRLPPSGISARLRSPDII